MGLTSPGRALGRSCLLLIFLKLFTLSGIPPFSTNLFRLASLLALLVGLNLSFLIGALAWFIKITKASHFESVEMSHKDPFLVLYFSFSSSMIFRPLCLLPSAVLFSLTIWPFGPPPPPSVTTITTAVEASEDALFLDWSVDLEYWCFLLNPSKCEASFFSVDPHQANLQPNLLLLSSRLRFNPTPTFLGVTFGCTLSFSKHVSSLKAKYFRCIFAFSLGPSKESLSLFCINFSLALSHLCFTRMISFPKRCQYHQIGTPPPSGQSRHCRMPLVLPNPSTTHRGFFTSPTSHPDLFDSFIL